MKNKSNLQRGKDFEKQVVTYLKDQGCITATKPHLHWKGYDKDFYNLFDIISISVGRLDLIQCKVNEAGKDVLDDVFLFCEKWKLDKVYCSVWENIEKYDLINITEYVYDIYSIKVKKHSEVIKDWSELTKG